MVSDKLSSAAERPRMTNWSLSEACCVVTPQANGYNSDSVDIAYPRTAPRRDINAIDRESGVRVAL